MSVITLKQQVINRLEKLPDNADIEQMMYELYVLENVQKGQKNIVKNQTMTQSELEQQIQTW